MTSSILSDKHFSPESDIALEATHLIQRMVRHILYDNCDHCRHILKDKDRAGPSRGQPTTTEDSTPNYQIRNVINDR
jgi:hypothetical protein